MRHRALAGIRTAVTIADWRTRQQYLDLVLERRTGNSMRDAINPSSKIVVKRAEDLENAPFNGRELINEVSTLLILASALLLSRGRIGHEQINITGRKCSIRDTAVGMGYRRSNWDVASVSYSCLTG